MAGISASMKGEGAMIAKVRIAPVERWCSESANYAARHPETLKICGAEVEIIPTSMAILPCGGKGLSRYWNLSDSSDATLDALTGKHHHGTRLCEHMLEMD